MKKVLLTALLLVPFLSLANTTSIFDNLSSHAPQATSEYPCHITFDDSRLIGKYPSVSACASAGVDIYAAYAGDEYNKNFTLSHVDENWREGYVKYEKCIQPLASGCGNWAEQTTRITLAYSPVQNQRCPPDTNPTYTYPHDSNTDGSPDKCFDPSELNMNDSCNVTEGDQYLTQEVTVPQGCFTRPDGSVCSYKAVDAFGNQVYQLNLEGDCYTSDPDPRLDGQEQNPPIGNDCQTYANGMTMCPEDPNNVCTDSGSTYGGANINNCASGCGYYNNQFVCITEDKDGDGLPNYKDPDIDGDGIHNDNDLDADGDGKDDPINNTPTQTGGEGNVTVNVDTQGIIDELKKQNKMGAAPDGISSQLDSLNEQYKAKLDEFSNKTSEELGYVDKLSFDAQATLAGSVTSGAPCQNFDMQVGDLGLFTYDLCGTSNRIKPILYWLFAILTIWHIFYLVNNTLRNTAS